MLAMEVYQEGCCNVKEAQSTEARARRSGYSAARKDFASGRCYAIMPGNGDEDEDLQQAR